ncbi:uncharacterized protein LOC100373597 [Saccoglossus kowalevskii]|uniref:Uncharacterized protein LOC100373597 n=1 Tax=Saccoglossus kowalevskii TaxID=10224 RepID=A0ABM0H0U7_SACKO|nr:PREDICTED: uncharacterized protein LOC100373597 [Saccoglossus kowalevskii]
MGRLNLLTLVAFSAYLINGVLAYNCPSDYPFPSCPRPNVTSDEETDTVCCYTTDSGYHCCDESLAIWAIVVIVIACLLAVALICGICACCCGFCACMGNYCQRSNYQSV